MKFSPPWPCGDLSERGGWVWNSYSDKRLLERTEYIYQEAIVSYNQIINAWFPSFKQRMNTAVIQPARLVGDFIVSESSGYEGRPILHWFLEPIDEGQCTSVDIRLAPDGEQTTELKWEESLNKARAMRPEEAEWISSTYHHGALDIFHSYPITDMVYRWLWRDLEKLSLVSGSLGYR